MKTIIAYDEKAIKRSISDLDYPLPKFRYYLKKGDIVEFGMETDIYEKKLSECYSICLIPVIITSKGSNMLVKTFLRDTVFRNWAYDCDRNLVFAENGPRFQELRNKCGTLRKLLLELRGKRLQVVDAQYYIAKLPYNRSVDKVVYGFEFI